MADREGPDAVTSADAKNPSHQQAARWIDDYNAIAPHSPVGYRTARQYRTEVLQLV